MPLTPTHRELLEKIKELTSEAESAQLREQLEAHRQASDAAYPQSESEPSAADSGPSKLDKQEAVMRVRALMAELGVNVVDILASLGRLDPDLPDGDGEPRSTRSRRASSAKAPRSRALPYEDDPSLPVRYRNRETGETWSGVGRVPAWIRDKELRGFSRDLFLVG